MSVETTEKSTAPVARRRSPALTWLCWLLAAPGLLWALIRLPGLERGPLVQLVAFTPYVAGWALAPLVLAVALRRRWPAVTAGVVALTLIGAVAPRALPDSAATGGPPLRVATANMLAGEGDAATVVGLVRTHRVDVLALQEFTPQTQAELDRLGLAELLPHRQLNAEVGTTGSALYTRFPLTDTGIRRNAGGFTQAYGTLAVPGAPPVRVESAHPMAPHALSTLPDWWADLRAQPAATPHGGLRILAGDFNSTLDHAVLRRLLGTGYVDAAAAVGQGLVGTWGPYDGDLIPPVTIDHVLVDRRIGVSGVSVHPLPGSDHRPVLAELTLPRS
ncbi:endonuclease/exonuclease/phosphatase family protein [Micromonospora sp. NPDC049679]|uniref:endonuclease/exonuclease/phosphatase family protein n=1 Tax=Micromonospora sp. NPDC049679 TaxID=3155920 RepID=UPI0033CEDCAE